MVSLILPKIVSVVKPPMPPGTTYSYHIPLMFSRYHQTLIVKSRRLIRPLSFEKVLGYLSDARGTFINR